MREQPSCQYYLLLIAAAQGPYGCFAARSLYIQNFYVFIRKCFGFAAADRLKEAVHDLQRKYDILSYTELGNDAVTLSVLRQISDTVLHGVDRTRDLNGLSLDLNIASVYLVRAENGSYALASARSEQTGKSVDLSLMYAEIERLRGTA